MGSKLVVVQLIDSIYRGGAQRVVLDIVRILPQYKHVVCYWASDADLEDEFLQANALLVKLPFDGILTFPRTLSALKRIVSQYQPAIIHAHMFIPNLLMRSLKKKFKTVSTYHGECFEQKGVRGLTFRWLERITLNRTDRVIAVSEYLKTYLQEKLNTSRQIDVVYNFGRQALSHASPGTSLPIRMVATSNNHPYKDYPLLLEAISQLGKDDVTLDIYGGNMNDLKIRAAELGLANVTFKGSVPDVTQYLNQYSVFIITSGFGEGFSISLIEAMGSGLPVICSDIPQFVEAVGDAAIVFRRADVASLISRLRMLIADLTQLRTLSSLAIKRAELFSKERFSKSILDVYTDQPQHR